MILYTTTQRTAGFRNHVERTADGCFRCLESHVADGADSHYPHPTVRTVFTDINDAISALTVANT